MKYRRAILFGLCLTALIIEVFGIPGSAGAKSGKSAALKGSGTSSSKNNAKQTVGPNAGTPKVSKASSGGIFSAWGIISLIIFVIGGSALVYYISIFYPLVCAKRGKYDVMEMTSV
ncbi:uncharacterized protein [Halyomorpha halys]|uniref:uncharacterized protein n=1 Tax=Halyomorpha halys TaxID=286706 RepID=UPI0006D4F560|nr:uncharacterized protein LOC106686985 isoform X2 [Halyomorpha halys]